MTIDPYFLSDYEEGLFYKRYQDPGNPEEVTWYQVFGRVSTAIGTNPTQTARFGRMMNEAIAIPSSPQIWNYGSGRRNPWQGSSCFTGPLGDSIPDFLRCDRDAHEVYMASGGYGVLADYVRPRGCKIKYTNSRSVGAMGIGGPVHRLEKTTGYITNGGRDRGALMVQLSGTHPDAVEFILSKIPVSLGFLDDWATNANSMLERRLTYPGQPAVVALYGSEFVFSKEWPTKDHVIDRIEGLNLADVNDLDQLIATGILSEDNTGRLVPQVFDWYLGEAGAWRPANRDWSLPLQNCNISVRVPDAMVKAAQRGDNWVFSWFSQDAPPEGQKPWTLTDIGGGDLRDLESGEIVHVSYGDDDIVTDLRYSEDHVGDYKYGVVLTTWEGLKKNLEPNPNNWKDVEHARFYRKVLMSRLDHLTGPIMAQQVLDLIFDAAHTSADPGIVFDGTYERFNPVDPVVYGKRLSNPCSEFVNPPNGSCNLISVNLRRCVDMVNKYDLQDEMAALGNNFAGPGNQDDYWAEQGLSTEKHWMVLRQSEAFRSYLEEVRKAAKVAFEYISEAHEKNVAPVEEIHRMSHDVFRTVGVGLMGLAEALMTFHVEYGSECGKMFAAATQFEIYLTCWEDSFSLAMDKNWPKPEGWNQDRMIDIFNHRMDYAIDYISIGEHVIRMDKILRRTIAGEYATNTCVTSIAPTGSISQIAGWLMTRLASNGITSNKMVTGSGEPPFSWATFVQNNAGSTEVQHDLWNTTEHRGKPWMKTADDVTPEGHVEMQAALCAFCCMSVSKTINMPESATIEDVAKGYMLAWELGVPGTSLYRNNSKPMQVLKALDCPSGDCEISSLEDLIREADAVQASPLYNKYRI